MTFLLPEPPELGAETAPALRWGVIGTGIGVTFTNSVHAHTPQRVVAIAGRDPQKTAMAASAIGVPRWYTDNRALIEDSEVEAVYISTPHPSHAEIALEAITAGKPVLIEKPMAMSEAETRTVVDAGRRAGVLVMEAMWTRYLPQSSVLRAILAEGLLGELTYMRADFGFSMPFDTDSRLWNARLGGGALLDAGIYPIALSSMVLGEPQEILTSGTVMPDGVDATAHLQLLHTGNEVSQLTTSLRGWLAASAEVVGTAGRVELAPAFCAPTQLTVTLGPWGGPETATWRHPWPADGSRPTDGYAYEAVAFASYVAEGRLESPLHTHGETLSIARTIETARRQLVAAGRVARVAAEGTLG